MPTINDPGLTMVRRAIDRGIAVTCAPGPSAVLDALALSGLPTDRFCYEGFVPRKHSERLQHFRALLSEPRTIVFYETPHRIEEAMDDLASIFPPERPMALARELTKDYEEVRRSTVEGIHDSVVNDPPRGELVLVIQGASDEELRSGIGAAAVLSFDALAALAQARARSENVRIKDAIAEVIAEHPLPDGSFPNKKEVYNATLALKK
jgi:16S rRNA (cytidine1402-2'-O)-methyltransferase